MIQWHFTTPDGRLQWLNRIYTLTDPEEYENVLSQEVELQSIVETPFDLVVVNSRKKP